MKNLLVTAIALFASATANAQIYECVDAKGKKEYAQICGPGTVRETPLRKSGASTAPAEAKPPAVKSLAEKDADFRKRAIERQDSDKKAAKEQTDAQTTKYNCDVARANLKQLQDGQRVASADPATGERIYMEDKDRPAAIATAQKAADSWCNLR